MNTFTISSDNGQHIVKINEDGGRFSSRLYVNRGETATLTTAKATTKAGAVKQAERMLARVA
jgi:hypothetical protein